jgi:hypothetical protein
MEAIEATPISPVVRDVLFGIDRGLFEDPVGQAILRTWKIVPDDEKIVTMLRQRVNAQRFREVMRQIPFQEPRLNPDQRDGLGGQWIILGLDVLRSGRRLNVPLQALNGHSLGEGTTGSGKTTRGRFLALQVAGLGVMTWLFDLRKREWRVLRPLLARLNIELTVLSGRAMKLNPLQVPAGVHPADWACNAADLLVAVLRLPPGAAKQLQAMLFSLYRRFGVFAGVRRFPTLFDLHAAATEERSGNAQSRAAIVDGLAPVLHSLGSAVLGYRLGWEAEDLAKHCIAMELAGLGEIDKDLLLNTLLISLFTSRIARGISNAKMDLWISLDEAQRLVSTRTGGSASAITDAIGLVRGAGVGLDLTVQSAHGLAPTVLSNTNLKWLGRCGSRADIEAIGGCIGLNRDQVAYVQQRLETGVFVCHVSDGAWRRPFLCRIPAMKCPSAQYHHNGGIGPLAALPTL